MCTPSFSTGMQAALPPELPGLEARPWTHCESSSTAPVWASAKWVINFWTLPGARHYTLHGFRLFNPWESCEIGIIFKPSLKMN